MTHPLPPTCERAILEQFLKAEAMALWAVRSAQAQDVPPAMITPSSNGSPSIDNPWPTNVTPEELKRFQSGSSPSLRIA